MPGVVLALAFRTRQTQGVERPRACGLAARRTVRRERASGARGDQHRVWPTQCV